MSSTTHSSAALRRPKAWNSDPAVLITVCAACHARLHRLASIRFLVPELLAALWSEQHPATPVQLQLPFGEEE